MESVEKITGESGELSASRSLIGERVTCTEVSSELKTAVVT
jgi:hypothetical protein